MIEHKHMHMHYNATITIAQIQVRLSEIKAELRLEDIDTGRRIELIEAKKACYEGIETYQKIQGFNLVNQVSERV